ncbi:hypothetical protein [Rubellicoccus peritrichatus]|uniref:Tetratricopeptide repeat protein n=1 Tax=Rubellicoccus peritrichatus TaxID=3080537 RepID=A0AAQ3LFN5_9BACT|nr:hypothetical protein [Puniceicoccus sp. CR14]WOO41194.1 hypothetical protein RZN69_21445 [Puniceicoccus sp. CR14]
MIKDKDSWLWRKGRVGVIAVLTLFLVGLLTSTFERPIWKEVKATQPELNLREVEGALGQGLVIGLIGGFRTIIADFLFIRANGFWEKRDRPKTEAMLNLVTAIDPRPMFFWLNGARMMAYDMPAWEMRDLGGYDEVPKSVENKIKAEYAQLGLDYIAKAEAFHPNDFRVPLEKAQIYLNRLNDTEAAATYYKEVTEMEDAPYYANRIYAEMLKRSGRPEEAYRYLVELYPTLPTDDFRASQDVVLERIRELEEQLNVPSFKRFPVQPKYEDVTGKFQIATPRGMMPLDSVSGGAADEIEFKVVPDMPPPSSHDHDHHGHDHDH